MNQKVKSQFARSAAIYAVIASLGAGTIQAPRAHAGEVVAGAVATMAIVGTVLIVGQVVSGRPIRKEILAEVAPDAMRFVATDGRESSQLLAATFAEARQEIEARGEDSTRFTDAQLARFIVQLGLDP